MMTEQEYAEERAELAIQEMRSVDWDKLSKDKQRKARRVLNIQLDYLKAQHPQSYLLEQDLSDIAHLR